MENTMKMKTKQFDKEEFLRMQFELIVEYGKDLVKLLSKLDNKISLGLMVEGMQRDLDRTDLRVTPYLSIDTEMLHDEIFQIMKNEVVNSKMDFIIEEFEYAIGQINHLRNLIRVERLKSC